MGSLGLQSFKLGNCVWVLRSTESFLLRVSGTILVSDPAVCRRFI